MKKIFVPMLLASTVVLGGCSSINALIVKAIFRVPTAQTTIQVATHSPVEQVFDCAQKRLDQLRKKEGFWDAEVTLRDLAAGTLETGEFQVDNAIGFRLRLEYQRTMGVINLRMKGAGPYFADIGVDKALATFKQGFDACFTAQE